TIALRRGSTDRIRPSPSPTQSPTATSTLSWTSRPGRRVRTAPPAVWTSNAARCAATTRPGTWPGSSLAANSGLHPSAPRSYSDNAGSFETWNEDGAAAVSGRSYARRAAQSAEAAVRAKRTVIWTILLRPGTGTRRRLGARHPAVKRGIRAAEPPGDVRHGEHAAAADEHPLIRPRQRAHEPAPVRRPREPREPPLHSQQRLHALARVDEERVRREK